MREPRIDFPIVNRLTLPGSGSSPRPERATAALFGTLVASAVPGLVCEHHAYTWSLLMFAAPSVAIGFGCRRSAWLKEAQRPLLAALTLLSPMGVLLNLLLAHRFFRYPNRDAVLGLYLRGIPVEEFAFYLLGFLALMLVYLWVRHELFHAGQAPISVVPARPGKAALVSLGLLAAACALEGGLPEYLGYLLVVPLPALLTFFPVVRPRLHWPSLSLLLTALLAVSVTWEVSLAVPGGWWGYQPEAMAGLFIARWGGLPVEAVGVWFLSGLTSVVTLEYLVNRRSRTPAGRARRTAPASARR